MKKRIKNILKFTVGLLILFVLFTKIGIRDILNLIPKTNFMFLIIALVPFLIALVAAAYNIQILLIGLKRKIRFLTTLKYYLLSWGAGLLLPGKIGDFTIIYFLKKENIPIGQSTAVSVVDKAISTLSLLIIGSFGFFLFFDKNDALKFMLITFFFIALGIFSIINPFTKKLLKKILGKWPEILNEFSESIKKYIKTKKKILGLNALITLLQWVLSAFSIFFIFLAFGVHVPLNIILLVSSITTVFSLVPITIAGLGIKESVGVFLYVSLGYSAIIAASVHLMIILQKYLVAFFAYLIYKF